MTIDTLRRLGAIIAAAAALTLAGCNTPPAFQVTNFEGSRVGTVESDQRPREWMLEDVAVHRRGLPRP